jgi:hypothetical protein
MSEERLRCAFERHSPNLTKVYTEIEKDKRYESHGKRSGIRRVSPRGAGSGARLHRHLSDQDSEKKERSSPTHDTGWADH